MEKIENIAQLRELILYVRNLKMGFVTNFYLDDAKHGAWIETGQFLYDKFDDTVLLLFDHEDSRSANYFTNLFYISTSIDAVLKHLQVYRETFDYDLYVLDIVGRDSTCQPIVDSLLKIKAYHDATLVRMNRIGDLTPIIGELDERVVYADLADADKINELLHANFDEKLEQLPLVSELRQMIAEKHILKCVIDGQIAGILLFDLNASTLYLRYWLTLSDYRDQGVGSALLKWFFYEGRETKRQILWVMQDNENAIKRYEHYGFAKENMFDNILFY